MIINRELKSQLNEYLQKKLGMYDYNKGWMKGDCPSCGEHKFGVHLGQNRSNCFKCGYKPQPLYLVLEVEKLQTISEVKALLNNLEGITYYEEEQVPFEIKLDNLLPEGYKNIKQGNSVIANAARNYLKKRGFDITELANSGWGYCTKGKYSGYIIMPYYYGNLLVYFNARLFIGAGPKFNNPPVEDFGIGKSFIIYNRDALYMYNLIYLVESVTNSRTIGDNSIAIGGKVLSKYQLNDIIKSPCEKIIIGLDRDAIHYAIDIAYLLVDHKKVKIMVMPNEIDINELGKNKSKNIALKAKYLNYNDIQKLKNKFRDEERT